MAVTEPVPVTLPAREGGVVEGRRVGGAGGRETGTLEPSVSGMISTVCGSVAGVCSGVEGEGKVCPELRVGTAVTLSVSTSREDTLVTVPDCTVRPGEGRELALEAAGKTGAATAGGTITPPELVLRRGRARESSEQMPGLHIIAIKLLGFQKHKLQVRPRNIERLLPSYIKTARLFRHGASESGKASFASASCGVCVCVACRVCSCGREVQ